MKYFLLLLFAVGLLSAQESPFTATAQFTDDRVDITLVGPADGHVAAASLKLLAPDGFTVTPDALPTPLPDELYPEGVYAPGTILHYRITPASPRPALTLMLQGCVKDLCFMPQRIALNGAPAPEPAAVPTVAPLAGLPEHYRSTAGYADAAKFGAWLDGHADEGNLLQRVFRRYGLWLAALLIIPLGLLLNLTPCVLPMIPINLGILGAGAMGAGRRRGLALGATYGIAMALSYGIVGALFVKLGGRFGAINASPWFNLGIGVLFVLLALAMFDVFFLDLSRYRTTRSFTRGSFGTAALLGAMTALLAGACVAPVLIWVLVLSTELYQNGHAAGLWLPLLLGAGLGLPWPFLGAGLSFLPKPGAWMTRLKQCFGILILLFAAYYFWTGIKLFRSTSASPQPDGYWRTDFTQALREAQTAHQDVLVDFWGVSCKACTVMDSSTLRDPAIRKRLDHLMRIKVQADDFNDPAVAPLAQHFRIVGLPTYIYIQNN